jgi:hypothetical protein
MNIPVSGTAATFPVAGSAGKPIRRQECLPHVLIYFVLGTGLLSGQTLTPVWREIGEHGVVARVVVTSPNECPAITVDGAMRRMTLRLPVPDGLRPVCELQLPASALPDNEPSRVVVIGDTGCRIKGGKVQDCNDPAKWPFERVASSAAVSKPDLVIHVGDYLYREEPCPPEAKASCGGTPAGDTWEAWDADFFTPARKLLAAAPWVFARGNHESCDRSWRGFFYYLDPRPFSATCDAFSPPYPVKLGKFELIMFDSATTSDKELDPKLVARYAAELATIHAEHAWLVLHHPLWGLKVAAGSAPGTPPSESPTEVTEAWEKSPVRGIDLIVSGHTHLFELLSFDHGRPTQLVAGNGGTEMAVALPGKIAGLKPRGATLLSSQDAHEFGYTALTRDAEGWRLTLTSTDGRTIKSATLPGK